MKNSAGLAWANALASLGQSTPMILRQYNQDVTGQNTRAGASDILKGMPTYGSPLEELAGGMTPEQGREVLSRTSPQDQKAAIALLSEKMPKSLPDPAMPEGGAIGALAEAKNPRHVKNAFVNRFMATLQNIESPRGGDTNSPHPMAKNGHQAHGALGVVPELHAQRVGLDPSNPADIARFKADPELQRQASENFVHELGKKYKWDPGMMRRGYYGITKDPDLPQYLADGRRMPSSNEDTAKFLTAFGEAERPADADAPDPSPWDNSLLTDLVKERPKMKTLPKKVTYGDQERYLLSKVKNPEQFELLKGYIANIGKLAEGERKDKDQDRDAFEKQEDRYSTNVRQVANLNFDTWKAGQEKGDRDRTYRTQNVQALRTQRDSLQKQLADVRGFQTRVAGGKESPEMLSAAYPNFFKSVHKDPSPLRELAGMLPGVPDAEAKPEISFDNQRFTEAVKALENDIQAIDEALASKSGARVTPPAAAPTALSKYLTPRKK